jgi:lipid A 3-O-deacylase
MNNQCARRENARDSTILRQPAVWHSFKKAIMASTNKTRNFVAAAAALFAMNAAHAAEGLVDSASFEIGGGKNVQMVRVAVQKDWNQRWFASSNGYHLSGYWDANLAQWRGNAYRNVSGHHQNITVVGLTPVFRYERDDKLGLYGEGGIGVSLFSELYNNSDNRLSTAFEFADHIGVGYVLDNKWDLSARIQHYSNGGIKHPNSGVNWFVLRAAYRF